MKKLILIFVSLLAAFILTECSDPVSAPPDIPIEVLLASPEKIRIENHDIVLNAYLWRDFQPVSPPDGKPLIALAYIETQNGSNLPSELSADAIYIVHNNQVWKSFFSTEQRPPSEIKPDRLTKIARNGPKWGPGVYVDVIVRVKQGNNEYLLKADSQYIGRTE